MRKLMTAMTLGITLMLGACAAIESTEPPKVRLVDVKLLESGVFEQQMLVDLRIINPNNVDLPLDGLAFELEVNDNVLAEGYSNEAVTVPRLGEARIPVRASTSLLGLVQQFVTLSQSDHLSYRLKGRAYVQGLFSRGVPFDQGGRLDLQTLQGGGQTLVPL